MWHTCELNQPPSILQLHPSKNTYLSLSYDPLQNISFPKSWLWVQSAVQTLWLVLQIFICASVALMRTTSFSRLLHLLTSVHWQDENCKHKYRETVLIITKELYQSILFSFIIRKAIKQIKTILRWYSTLSGLP